jgi:hypothetical protein
LTDQQRAIGEASRFTDCRFYFREKVMKIKVTRSGGFAGITENVASVDTAGLKPAQAKQVEELISSLDFFKLPGAVAGEAVGADYQQYEISVSRGAEKHQVKFLDDESPQTAKLKQLVNKLTQL